MKIKREVFEAFTKEMGDAGAGFLVIIPFTFPRTDQKVEEIIASGGFGGYGIEPEEN